MSSGGRTGLAPRTGEGRPPNALPLVVCLGNASRGDDGVGPEVARLLRARGRLAGRVIELSGEGTGLLDVWDGAELVIAVDAMRSGTTPGTIRRIDVGPDDLPSLGLGVSTHAFSLAEAIRLGRALGRMPGRLVVLAVEAATLTHGAGLTPEVRNAAAEVVLQVERELDTVTAEGPRERPGGANDA